MLLSILIFTSSIILLYLSSRSLINQLLKLFSKITKSKTISINLLFFLLLPGIFLHEFSHILTAAILHVPTGKMTLKPMLHGSKPSTSSLQLGSAQIAHTDPIRLTLIGTAPFIFGTAILWLILTFGLNLNPTTITFTSLSALTNLSIYLLLLFGYLLFAISNTMFSSPSDLQSAGLPIILILIILGIFKLTNLNLPQSILTYITNFLSLLSIIFFLT
ncbi:MAG: hypothetical protein U9Q63_00350, partial [Patescibacteria group bacterium]|nr:hypothetical protein [Patescibacteria group bacterium]